MSWRGHLGHTIVRICNIHLHKNITNGKNKEKDIRPYIKTFHNIFNTPKARVESEHHVLWHVMNRLLFFFSDCNLYSVCSIFLDQKISRNISQCPNNSQVDAVFTECPSCEL